MKLAWFKPWGWIYRPVRIEGWLCVFGCATLIAWVFMVVDRNSHSGSDTLIGTFPWAWIFLATLNWIASKTSEK
jgi:hypothetical protein